MTLWAEIGRYCRTVLHLRPRQIWTRVLRRVVPPHVSSGPPPDRRATSAFFHRPIAASDRWSAPDRVSLLNIERHFPGAIDWAPSDVPRLWVYELNYFADLPRSAVDRRREWMSGTVDSWIDANPPGTPDTWDPYPISIRVVNWVKWTLLLEGAGAGSSGRGAGARAGAARVGAPDPATPDDRVLGSLAAQLRYLERRLEFDIAANHLMANAVALTIGGLFFGGEEGDRWAKRGFALLFRELEEQVCDDGGHYERSPMYHAIVLEQLLDVLNLWIAFAEGVPRGWRDARPRLEGRAIAMLDWLAAMTHPDGGTSFFNDATLGAAATCNDLFDYAERLGLATVRKEFKGVRCLEDTDFFRITSEDGLTVVLFDAGVPKPAYQPGHAHSESLSFELSRDGRRFFVNSGVSTYKPGDERLWQRRTAAHNTVRIDEEEQSEVWASHRCGRRADFLHAGPREGGAYAAHDGYAFLPGKPQHYREIIVTDGSVEIIDNIDGEGEHLLEWFFHLHPEVTARVREREVELSLDGRPVAAVSFPFGAVASIENGSWHPGFNVSIQNTSVHVALRVSLPFGFHTTLGWT